MPKIKALTPQSFGRYLEPFAGSACVFLALHPDKAVLGDINDELIRTYRTVRAAPRDVARALADFPRDHDLYRFLRAIPPATLDSRTRAARFLYLNRHSFNGVYRTNREGQFNVPMGTKTGSVPTESELVAFSRRLQRVELVAGDFEVILRLAGRQDFIYLDPPYVDPNRRFRGEYGYNTFTVADEDRLCVGLDMADRAGAKILLSYNRQIAKAFPAWKITRVVVQRSVAGFTERRRSVHEVLITNF